MIPVHDSRAVGHVESTLWDTVAQAHVYLTRSARTIMAKLDPAHRAGLTAAYVRVGQELLAQAEQVAVAPTWTRRTWPRRRYPQQCYPKTVKYVREHADIAGMRLVHGVISHAGHQAPLDHAWVELPGGIVFDGVVQAFFTCDSYSRVLSAVQLDSYTSVRDRATAHQARPPRPLELALGAYPGAGAGVLRGDWHVALQDGATRSHGVPHAPARAGVRAGCQRTRQ